MTVVALSSSFVEIFLFLVFGGTLFSLCKLFWGTFLTSGIHPVSSSLSPFLEPLHVTPLNTFSFLLLCSYRPTFTCSVPILSYSA